MGATECVGGTLLAIALANMARFALQLHKRGSIVRDPISRLWHDLESASSSQKQCQRMRTSRLSYCQPDIVKDACGSKRRIPEFA